MVREEQRAIIRPTGARFCWIEREDKIPLGFQHFFDPAGICS